MQCGKLEAIPRQLFGNLLLLLRSNFHKHRATLDEQQYSNNVLDQQEWQNQRQTSDNMEFTIIFIIILITFAEIERGF